MKRSKTRRNVVRFRNSLNMLTFFFFFRRVSNFFFRRMFNFNTVTTLTLCLFMCVVCGLRGEGGGVKRN